MYFCIFLNVFGLIFLVKAYQNEPISFDVDHRCDLMFQEIDRNPGEAFTVAKLDTFGNRSLIHGKSLRKRSMGGSSSYSGHRVKNDPRDEEVPCDAYVIHRIASCEDYFASDVFVQPGVNRSQLKEQEPGGRVMYRKLMPPSIEIGEDQLTSSGDSEVG